MVYSNRSQSAPFYGVFCAATALSLFKMILKKPLPVWKLSLGVLIFSLAADLAFDLYHQLYECPTRNASPGREKHLDSRSSSNLYRLVRKMGKDIGERHPGVPRKLGEAAAFIVNEWRRYGYQPVYPSGSPHWMVEKKSRHNPNSVIFVMAHYDSDPGSSGVNDNATGVAVMLELSRLLKAVDIFRTIRFVAFLRPPSSSPGASGAQLPLSTFMKPRESTTAIFSLDALGHYSNARQSQHYGGPFSWFLPDQGNFIALVGDYHSRGLIKVTSSILSIYCNLPRACIRIVKGFPSAIGHEHDPFWAQSHQALVVTDTGKLRWDKEFSTVDSVASVDFSKLTALTEGLSALLPCIANDRSDLPGDQREKIKSGECGFISGGAVF